MNEQQLKELNRFCHDLGCPFEYELRGCGSGYVAQLTLPNKRYVDSFIINPSSEFFELLESWLANRNLHVGYNNTKSILWVWEMRK